MKLKISGKNIIVILLLAIVSASMMTNTLKVAKTESAHDIVAFVSDQDEPGNWDIYTLNLTDLSITRLTTDPAIDNHPDISHDGTKIVWSSTRGAGVDFDIYIANMADVEGTPPKRLTFDSYPNGPQTHYPDRHPHWSPDGTMIVFDSKNRPLDHPIEVKSECSVPKIITPPKFFENLNIIKIDALGNVVDYRELDIRDAWDSINYPDIWRSDTATYVGHPSFSPDGTKIVFSAAIDVDGTAWEVYTVDIEIVSMSLVGDSLQRITEGTLYPPNPNPVQMSGGAHFTPDGSKILFSSTRTPLGNSQLFWAYATDIDEPVRSSRRLTWHLANDYVPEPLPDGRIVFVSDRGEPSMCLPPGVEGPTMDLDIFIMNSDGSGQTNLTDNDAANEMLLIADEVSWFCGIPPNLKSCTFYPRIMNKEALWLMRYADIMIPPDLLERFNISDARPVYLTYWNNLEQWVMKESLRQPRLWEDWQHILVNTEFLMDTFPGFENETALLEWMTNTAPIREELFVLPSLMHEGGIGQSIINIAVTDVKPSKTVVVQGDHVFIDVTLENHGASSETFFLTVFANLEMVQMWTIILMGGNRLTIPIIWDTTGFAPGDYTIRAEVIPIPGEITTTDNTYVDGTVRITLLRLGDLNGDGVVNYQDAFLFRLAYIGEYNPLADFDQDGDVDYWDAFLFRGYYIAG